MSARLSSNPRVDRNSTLTQLWFLTNHSLSLTMKIELNIFHLPPKFHSQLFFLFWAVIHGFRLFWLLRNERAHNFCRAYAPTDCLRVIPFGILDIDHTTTDFSRKSCQMLPLTYCFTYVKSLIDWQLQSIFLLFHRYVSRRDGRCIGPWHRFWDLVAVKMAIVY